jgi:hypothetical protein
LNIYNTAYKSEDVPQIKVDFAMLPQLQEYLDNLERSFKKEDDDKLGEKAKQGGEQELQECGGKVCCSDESSQK